MTFPATHLTLDTREAKMIALPHLIFLDQTVGS